MYTVELIVRVFKITPTRTLKSRHMEGMIIANNASDHNLVSVLILGPKYCQENATGNGGAHYLVRI